MRHRGRSPLPSLAGAVVAVALTLASASSASAATRYCGTVTYRLQGAKLYEKVYALRSASCTRARFVLTILDRSYRPPPAWRCTYSSSYLVTTCRSGRATIRGVDYTPPTVAPPSTPGGGGPGQCTDVQGFLGEYSMSIVARAVGCHEAQQVVTDDMTTPACVTDCILTEGADVFECTPQGSAYGPFQDETCVAVDGAAQVDFTIVNGP